MENFIVSALKYRPSTFNTVVGQEGIVRTLKNAIKNHQLAQAFLFCGPRGVGKTTTARIFAKTINCKNTTKEIEACNQCESCKSFNNMASFNIHELDAASNNSVDDIRTLVDQVRIPPQAGDYKVYIIDEVHMLSSQAFNAFLKTLEEPPSYAKFILATTEKHKIIPTILSRCQIYDFKRITIEDIANHLAYVAKEENVDAEKDALHIIAQKADGALRDALSIFDQIVSFGGNKITYHNVIENLNVLDYDYFFNITDYLVNGNINNTLIAINEIIDNGFDGQYFISGFGEHLRNLLVSKNQETIQLLEVGDNIKKKYFEQTKTIGADFIIKALDRLNKMDFQYKTSYNKTLLLESGLLQIMSIGLTNSSKRDVAQLPKTEMKTENSIVHSKKIVAHKSSNTIITDQDNVKKTSSQIIKQKGYPRTTSIRIKESANEVKESINTLEKPTTAFDQEKLNIAWDKVIELYQGSKSLYPTLKNNIPQKTGSESIEIIVESKIQFVSIEDIKQDLLESLRKELYNYKVSLTLSVAETKKKETTLYTSQEKYQKMKEKNPALKNFKDQLGLELEY